MSAFDTAKEIVRIGSTAGLSKDVIDLLDKKVALLVDENKALSTKVSSLEIENVQLRRQLQNLRPVADVLPQEDRAVLEVLESDPKRWTPDEVATRISGSSVGRIHALLTKLSNEKRAYSFVGGYEIAPLGRTSLHGV